LPAKKPQFSFKTLGYTLDLRQAKDDIQLSVRCDLLPYVVEQSFNRLIVKFMILVSKGTHLDGKFLAGNLIYGKSVRITGRHQRAGF
jgi:hypothetical protein